MQKIIKKLFQHLLFFQEEIQKRFFKDKPLFQNSTLEQLFKKYRSHFLIILGLIFLSFISEFLPLLRKEKTKAISLDSLVPKDFVLLPIEIANGRDIVNIIGAYGVVDLYTYSEQTGLPEKQAAGAIKILPPDTEEGRFAALIPEKEAPYLFKHSDPFYAVVQNPNKKGSKVYKKRVKKSLIIIEEKF